MKPLHIGLVALVLAAALVVGAMLVDVLLMERDPFAAGFHELAYEMQLEGDASPALAELTGQVIGRRLAALGVPCETVIDGSRVIRVRVPQMAAADLDQIRRLIERPGRLEFRLVCNDEAMLAKTTPGENPPEGYHWYLEVPWVGTESWCLVSDSFPDGVEITTDLLSAAEQEDEMGRPAVRVTFNALGQVRMQQVTSANIGRQLAIIADDVRDGDRIVTPGTLISAPVIRSMVSGAAQINGSFSEQEAQELCFALTAGELPVPLRRVAPGTNAPAESAPPGQL